MSYLRLNKVAAPTTPASGKAVVYLSNTTPPMLRVKDDAGNDGSFTDVVNASTASQSPAATTRTYINGSALYLPLKLQIGTCLRWRFNMTKTAAGTATSTIDIAFGTAGTTADTARVSFTKPAGTGVIDEAWVEVSAICRGPLSASGVVAGEILVTHNLATTGHMAQQCYVANVISAAFDVTTPTYAGLCITTGSLDVITIQMCKAWADKF